MCTGITQLDPIDRLMSLAKFNHVVMLRNMLMSSTHIVRRIVPFILIAHGKWIYIYKRNSELPTELSLPPLT